MMSDLVARLRQDSQRTLNQEAADELTRLLAIEAKLPKCWGLRDGKLVQDVNVVRLWPDIPEIEAAVREHMVMATHLDGARLFNAVVATGIPADQWAQHFDTVSVCFSKGLGAPVGSALAGPRDLIQKARRRRKALGGGMRQAGIIAAGALYALENHIDRLADDHAMAQRLGEVIRDIEGLTLAPSEVDTNMVIFEVEPKLGTAAEFTGRLSELGLLMLAVGPTRVRAVAHLDLDAVAVEQAEPILREAGGAALSGQPASTVGKSYG